MGVDVETVEWNRRRYDALAPVYDLATRPLAEGRRRSMQLLAPQRGERVLLLGAGTGLDFPNLPDETRGVAIDVSARMLRRAQRRAAARPVDVALMDGERLAFRDGSFDCVALHLILAVIPHPEQAAREAARVLKPGGRVAVFDKFLPDDQGPSSTRTALNAVTRIVATDINRHLGPILEAAGLEPYHEEPSALKGVFKIVLARKP